MSSGEKASSGRIAALDVARGLALLGILLVNVEFFALPFGVAAEVGGNAASGLGRALSAAVAILCEGKFYPLFSLLFGIGLALQKRSAAARGVAFHSFYLRRLGFLAGAGVAHALLLWYGDILFVYSVAGLLLLIASRVGGRRLLSVGVALLLIGVLLSSSMALIAGLASPRESAEIETATAETAAESPASGAERAGPFRRLIGALAAGDAPEPGSEIWRNAETEAFRDGPYLDAVGVRALDFVAILVGQLFGGGFHIVGLFFLGAGILELGFFEPGSSWPRRMALAGAALGLPLVVVGFLLEGSTGDFGLFFWTLCNTIGGPLLALAYLSLVTLRVGWRAGGPLSRALARTGRMAFTNYLAQTVIATFVTYHWGLARFGSLDAMERYALAAAVFALQVGASVLWLRGFRLGPLEWIWRSVTYGRRMPLRR